MKVRYYIDEDDMFNRYVKPWLIFVIISLALFFGIKTLIDLNIKNSNEYRRNEEINQSLGQAPDERDYRENVPDEEIGNYYYNGGEIIDYPNEVYLVKKVVSGNTIIINFQNKETTIRLLGVAIPECYADQAKKETETVLLNRRIKIGFDKKINFRDTDGAVLAYVTIDTYSYNLTMISNGVGVVDDRYDFEYKKSYEYQQTVDAAMLKQGLWSVCKEQELDEGWTTTNRSNQA